MNNYTYWKNDELQHSGVKGMKWGIRKQREYIASKIKGREEIAYRNLSRRTKRLAAAAALSDLASRASLMAFNKIPKSSSGFKTAAALLGITGKVAGGYLGGRAAASGLLTIGAHKLYANTLSGKERKKENAKIVRNAALATGLVGAQFAGKRIANSVRKASVKATPYAYSAGAAARNVVNNVSRVWQNATARPYGSMKIQKAPKTGYDTIKRLMG